MWLLNSLSEEFVKNPTKFRILIFMMIKWLQNISLQVGKVSVAFDNRKTVKSSTPLEGFESNFWNKRVVFYLFLECSILSWLHVKIFCNWPRRNGTNLSPEPAYRSRTSGWNSNFLSQKHIIHLRYLLRKF